MHRRWIWLSVLVIPLVVAACGAPAVSAPTQAPAKQAAPAAPTTAPAAPAPAAPTVAKAAEPAKAAAPSVIKLGGLFSMSGQSSSVGVTQMNGAKLAVQELNARGGIKLGGQQVKVELVERDDESKPETGVQRYRQLVQDDKVNLISGGTSANVPMAINEEMKKTPGMLITSNGLGIATFTKQNKAPYLMQYPLSTYANGRVTARILMEMKPKSVVLFLPDYAYGQDMDKAIMEILPKQAPEIKVTTVFHPQGATDLSSYIQKIMDLRPDVTLFSQWGNDGIVALKQAYEMGLMKRTKIFFAHIATSFAQAIPAEALQEVEGHAYFYHDLTGLGDPETEKAAAEFTAKYRAAFNTFPDTYSSTSYGGIMEFARGIEISQSLDPGKVYGALMANPKITSGVRGPGEWGIDGQTRWKYFFFRGFGKPAAERKDPKFDWFKVTAGTPDNGGTPDPKDLGW
ncbi:MAG: ABC transporter substrate-binding protein [Chloroflexota bacterium]